MRLKVINFLTLSLENLLHCLFSIAFRDPAALRSKSQLKVSHKLETRCHARRNDQRTFCLSIELGKGNVGRSEFRYANIVSRTLSTLSRKGRARICVRVAEELNRRRNKAARPHCVHLRFHPYFPLPRYEVCRRCVTCRCLLVAYLQRLLA